MTVSPVWIGDVGNLLVTVRGGGTSALKSVSSSGLLCSLALPLEFDREEVRSVEILEHDIPEVRLSCVEQLLKLINLGKLDDLHHLCRVRHTLDHCYVVQVKEVKNFSESIIHHLAAKIDNYFLVLIGPFFQLVIEDLLEMGRFDNHNCYMGLNLLL